MRIDSLEIKSAWKNLNGFRIDFDENRDITVIIGKNGSAKSNLLEALITIFRNLDLSDPAPFSYELRYILNGKRVTILADAERQPRAEVEGKKISLRELRDNWMPKYVVGYYSGDVPPR